MSTFEAEVASTAGEVLVADEHKISGRSVASWVVYDLANTIFSMGVISVVFPLYVTGVVGEAQKSQYVGYITSISMAIIFVVSPLLGAMTDRARRRMPFLIASTLLCVFATVLMGHVSFKATVALFIISNIVYQAGLQFYDAMLPDVTTEANRGKVGGIGVGIGYLGSYVALGMTFLFADFPTQFTAIGVMFLLFALPSFFFVKERGNRNPQRISPRMIVESTAETVRALRSSNEYPGLLRFLVGRMFYTDAINTVISMMLLYTVSIALSTGYSQDQGEAKGKLIMMLAISFAIAGGFIWGRMSDRIGPKRTLDYVIYCWMLIFAAASAVGIFGLPVWTLFVVASAAGFCMGGVWAADRPLMLRLTPPARIGEFYGLYGMVGRFSAITGPLMWAIMTGFAIKRGATVAQSQGLALLALLAMVIVSYLILRPISDAPRKWTGKDLMR